MLYESKSQIPKGIKVFDRRYQGNNPDKLCHSWGGNCLPLVTVTDSSAQGALSDLTDQELNDLHNLLSSVTDTGNITSFILDNEYIFSTFLYPPYLDSAEVGSYFIENHLLYSNGLMSINFYKQADSSLVIAYPIVNEY